MVCTLFACGTSGDSQETTGEAGKGYGPDLRASNDLEGVHVYSLKTIANAGFTLVEMLVLGRRNVVVDASIELPMTILIKCKKQSFMKGSAKSRAGMHGHLSHVHVHELFMFVSS